MGIFRSLYYLLTPKQRLWARRIVYFPSDVLKKRHPLEPPKGKIYIGSGDFISQGINTHKLFVKYGNVKPDHNVLDIGSGIGRMAVPFTKYLTEDGSYEGFDIVKEGVNWCKKKISSRYSNFNFTHVDLKNELYNLSTTTKAASFTFPYKDNTFDFCFLTSVFTHMLPEDMLNYLSEIKRVLKPGATCFATYFLIDSTTPMAYSHANKSFPKHLGHYYLMDDTVKEANVAFEKSYVVQHITQLGFNIKYDLTGWWTDSNTDLHVDYQDILVFTLEDN